MLLGKRDKELRKRKTMDVVTVFGDIRHNRHSRRPFVRELNRVGHMMGWQRCQDVRKAAYALALQVIPSLAQK